MVSEELKIGVRASSGQPLKSCGLITILYYVFIETLKYFGIN